MCGIAGFIDPKLSKEESQHMVTAMLESIAHRGPDARGLWNEMPVVFGHNRLSIIDLSAEGNQPMEYFDSVIIYNGEIYNYIEVRNELKAKGYIFKTQSDTEVILAAYREYGENCVQRFVGMWAFALWDKKKKNFINCLVTALNFTCAAMLKWGAVLVAGLTAPLSRQVFRPYFPRQGSKHLPFITREKMRWTRGRG